MADRELKNRIKLFVSLPISTLDRLSLKRHVDAIGHLLRDATEDHAS